MAALANATIVLPFWGAIGAVVIWATQKDKSRYVSFQSLQAVVYHFAIILGGLLMGACYMCSLVAFPLFLGLSAASSPSGEPGPLIFVPMTFPFALLGAGILGWALAVAYGLYAAWSTLQGRDFRYVVIGRRLEGYLAQP
jgi:uncharacterized Tic20 family protein